MNNEFVPYEEAFALKDLGFDEPCLGYFDILYNGITQSSSGRLILGKDPDTLQCTKKMLYIHGQLKILAPTSSQAFRWFRKEHMLKGEVTHADSNGSSKFTIWRWNFDNNIGKWERISNIGTFNTWEEAELECLKKLIQIIKNK